MHVPIRFVLVIALGFFCAEALFAQDKKAKEKTSADLAADAFFKLRDEKDVEPTPQRQAVIIDAGLTFLKLYADHNRSTGVVNSLATFGTTMRDKKQAALRTAWLSKLQYEIIRQSGGEEKNKEAPAAFKALAAATAGQLAKDQPTKENIVDFRDRIDRVAEMPDSARYLIDLERNFIQLLKQIKNNALAEKQASKLLANSDKRMVKMANEELNLILIAKQPLELAFTALDGKTVDVATMRGKPLFFLFWATTNEASVNELDTLWEAFQSLPESKFVIILVNCDKAEDRPAVEKFVKSNRLKHTVWFAGTGFENELGAKLNITKLPANALFDAKGMFVSVGNKAQGSNGALKKLLEAK